MILSALEAGLAASFIGALDDREVGQVLKLPTDGSAVPLALVPMGYGDKDEAMKWRAANRSSIKGRRMRLGQLVHWESW